MRKARLKVGCDESSVYHCMSRIVAGEALLGLREKEVFRKQMRYVADFCGVQVLTYCIMSNHFHILVRVPSESEARQVDDRELARRLRALYPKNEADGWLSRLDPDCEGSEACRKRLLERMGDISAFMKELKQRFSIWYNHAHHRFGTLWAERFKSVLVEPAPHALLTVACYIDLNPVRAGLCEDPKDYRFCGYAEATAGGENGRRGLVRLMEGKDWRAVVREYRLILFGRGYYTELGGQMGISPEKLEEVKRKGGELSLTESLRCRVRYFTDGAAIGSRDYVERLFRERRELFGKRRRTGARKMGGGGWRDLYALRELRSP